MQCKISGYEAQTLSVVLEPGESFYAERGAMLMVDDGIDMESEMTGKGLLGIISSKLSGESLIIVRFSNRSSSQRRLIVNGSRMGLCHIDLLPSDSLVIRSGCYVASKNKLNIGLHVSARKFLSGMGLTFQEVSGSGALFVDTCGATIVQELASGQRIVVDENHLLALKNISDDRLQAGFSAGNIFSGEGLSKTTIVGPGTVYLSPISLMPVPQA